jgi:hypothetical protein
MTTAELSVPDAAHAPPRGWTRLALRDLAYSGAVCMWGVAAFTIMVSGLSVTAALLPIVVGVFVWVGFVHALRWTTYVDRRLAGWQRGEPVPAVYRRPAEGGPMPWLRTLTSDPQTWRDLAWLAVTSIVGFAWGLAVLTAAGLVVAYVSMPIWYWAVDHPGTEYGVTNLGFVTIDTLGEAAVAAVLGLALIPLVLLFARWCAATHSALAVRLLGPASAPATTQAGGGHA